MNLKKARICIDCETIYEGWDCACPKCGNHVTFYLIKWCPSIVDTRQDFIPAHNGNGKSPWWARLPIVGRMFNPVDVAF